MGGKWAEIAQTNEEGRVRLLQEQVARQSAEASLAEERAKVLTLVATLERLDVLAADAAVEAERLRTCESRVAVELSQSRATERVLVASLSRADAGLWGKDEALQAATAARESTERELSEAKELIASQSAALERAASGLATEQETSAKLRRETTELTARSKRANLARQEKERQLSVAQQEKARLAGLLSKKDTLARELNLQLKKSARAGGGHEASCDAPDGPVGRGPPRAEQRATSSPVGSAWPAQNEAFVTPQVPGVQQRFAGWREASPEQRHAALRAENAVLLGVLQERDAALSVTQSEADVLRKDLAALKTKWRTAVAGARKGTATPPATPATPTRTPPPRAKPPSPYQPGRPIPGVSSPIPSHSPN